MSGRVSELRMPVLGADMTEGRIVEWLIEPGDHVDRGDIVAVVDTDKADIEIEVFEAATIRTILVDVGEVVPVGTPIAAIEPDVETARTSTERPDRRATSADTAASAPTRISSPLIRHLADSRHVDLSRLDGSGAGGRVLRDDVERAAVSDTTPGRTRRGRVTPRARRLAAEASVDPARLEELASAGVVTSHDVAALIPGVAGTTPSAVVDPMRRRIASLMTRSWREIPHYHLEQELDVTHALTQLEAINEGRSIDRRIVPAAALLAAAAHASRAVPACNGWWQDGFVPATQVDVGLVVSLRGGGVIVPTIERADELGLDRLMAIMRGLIERARRGRLRASDVGNAGITVTNLGDQGADVVFGVIHPPQVALVGFGAIRDVPCVDRGEIRVARTVRATLAGDHRAIDGLTGSRFLAEMQRALDGLEEQLEDRP